MTFQARVHGKWILSGEHAVLRGSPAIAFPVYGKYLELTWSDSESFSASFSGSSGAEFQLLFSGVFDRALEILGRKDDRKLKRGEFRIESTLPVGAGLGASAALAVAMGRWFVSQGVVSEEKLFWFCRELENLFHGESSGVDVAVAIEARGLYFSRGSVDGGSERIMRGFDPLWQPRWYISYSGSRGLTSECVSQVKTMLAVNPERGAKIDAQMRDSVFLAEKALTVKMSEADRLVLLTRAIDLGCACFEEWDLVRGELGRHLAWLKENGALAVKPTGSGGGGYALSLWEKSPPREIEPQLIPVFLEYS